MICDNLYISEVLSLELVCKLNRKRLNTYWYKRYNQYVPNDLTTKVITKQMYLTFGRVIIFNSKRRYYYLDLDFEVSDLQCVGRWNLAVTDFAGRTYDVIIIRTNIESYFGYNKRILLKDIDFKISARDNLTKIIEPATLNGIRVSSADDISVISHIDKSIADEISMLNRRNKCIGSGYVIFKSLPSKEYIYYGKLTPDDPSYICLLKDGKLCEVTNNTTKPRSGEALSIYSEYCKLDICEKHRFNKILDMGPWYVFAALTSTSK